MQAEMAAFEAARKKSLKELGGTTLYTTLSPCPMCAGAAIFFQVAKVVIAENMNMSGQEQMLKDRGIEVVVVDDKECEERMRQFIQGNPDKW